MKAEGFSGFLIGLSLGAIASWCSWCLGGEKDPISTWTKLFDLLRQKGAFGLIATNTIAQGGTRSAGLRFICNNGGIIYNAMRRYRWPGLAAVVVSIIHIWKTGVLERK